MELDQLKHQWRKEMEIAQQPKMLNFSDIQEKVSRFNKSIFYRDSTEIGTAFLVIFIFSQRLITNPQVGWLTYFGTGIIISAALLIVFMLLKSKKVDIKNDWTLASRIDLEIEKLEKQKKLLNSVGSWYLAPIMSGVFFTRLGYHHDNTGSYIPDTGILVYFVGCLILSVFIYWLNRRAVSKKIDPVLTAVTNLRQQLNEQ
jgi:MFS family permease